MSVGVGELVPQPHGGALRRGNPGNVGHPPSWVRVRLREGLVKATPKLKRAMETGKDPRTGQLLPYRDWLDTCRVVAQITMPSQTQLGGLDGAPFNVLVGAAAAAVGDGAPLNIAVRGGPEEEPIAEPELEPAPRLALTPRVASAEPMPALTVRDRAVEGDRTATPRGGAGVTPGREGHAGPFGPGVTKQ